MLEIIMNSINKTNNMKTTPIIKYYDERTDKTYCLVLHDESMREKSLKELKARAEYEYRESLSPKERAEFKKVNENFTCPFCKADTKITSRKITKTSGFIFITTTIHDVFKCEKCQKEFEQYELDNEINSAKQHNFQVENFEYFKDLKYKGKEAKNYIKIDEYSPYEIYEAITK